MVQGVKTRVKHVLVCSPSDPAISDIRECRVSKNLHCSRQGYDAVLSSWGLPMFWRRKPFPSSGCTANLYCIRAIWKSPILGRRGTHCLQLVNNCSQYCRAPFCRPFVVHSVDVAQATTFASFVL